MGQFRKGRWRWRRFGSGSPPPLSQSVSQSVSQSHPPLFGALAVAREAGGSKFRSVPLPQWFPFPTQQDKHFISLSSPSVRPSVFLVCLVHVQQRWWRDVFAVFLTSAAEAEAAFILLRKEVGVETSSRARVRRTLVFQAQFYRSFRAKANDSQKRGGILSLPRRRLI